MKKYETLKNLLIAVEELRSMYKIEDDFELLNKWAEEIDINNYKSDVIGKIQNVAIATIQHLRMDFGIDTVKPDQRITEVLKREFLFKQVTQIKAIRIIEELGKISNNSVRKLDLILVNYGSGYYDNKKYKVQQEVRTEIAKKLLERGVNKQIIIDCTGIEI